jgi:SET domain-containing protein
MKLFVVRRSGIHGRGVFTLGSLIGRRKIGEIAGQLVRLPEARRRVEGQARIYLIELTRRYALDCSRSNAFKHLNHSCQPNCYLRIYRKRVEVYTLRTVAAGQELTVDYGITPHRGGMACGCGATNCKRRL